jgi:hypothetical protein
MQKINLVIPIEIFIKESKGLGPIIYSLIDMAL